MHPQTFGVITCRFIFSSFFSPRWDVLICCERHSIFIKEMINNWRGRLKMNHSQHTSEASRGGVGGGRSACVKRDAATSHLCLEFNVASSGPPLLSPPAYIWQHCAIKHVCPNQQKIVIWLQTVNARANKCVNSAFLGLSWQLSTDYQFIIFVLWWQILLQHCCSGEWEWG